MTKSKKTFPAIRIDNDLHDEVKTAAFHKKSSMKRITETALREWLTRNPVQQHDQKKKSRRKR